MGIMTVFRGRNIWNFSSAHFEFSPTASLPTFTLNLFIPVSQSKIVFFICIRDLSDQLLKVRKFLFTVQLHKIFLEK